MDIKTVEQSIPVKGENSLDVLDSHRKVQIIVRASSDAPYYSEHSFRPSTNGCYKQLGLIRARLLRLSGSRAQSAKTQTIRRGASKPR